jgi:hypothetical protein
VIFTSTAKATFADPVSVLEKATLAVFAYKSAMMLCQQGQTKAIIDYITLIEADGFS